MKAKREYPKMDPKVKRWWVRDLESGKFKQTRSTLHRTHDKNNRPIKNGGYCCLGVLCVGLAKRYPDKIEWDDEKGTVRHKRSERSSNTSNTTLPDKIENMIKLDRLATSRLMNMNDMKVPFRNIAAWIRKNL